MKRGEKTHKLNIVHLSNRSLCFFLGRKSDKAEASAPAGALLLHDNSIGDGAEVAEAWKRNVMVLSDHMTCKESEIVLRTHSHEGRPRW